MAIFIVSSRWYEVAKETIGLSVDYNAGLCPKTVDQHLDPIVSGAPRIKGELLTHQHLPKLIQRLSSDHHSKVWSTRRRGDKQMLG